MNKFLFKTEKPINIKALILFESAISSLLLILILSLFCISIKAKASEKPRVIVTLNEEIYDEWSKVGFLRYSNERGVEGIITSSSHYHWNVHKWTGGIYNNKLLKNLK